MGLVAVAKRQLLRERSAGADAGQRSFVWACNRPIHHIHETEGAGRVMWRHSCPPACGRAHQPARPRAIHRSWSHPPRKRPARHRRRTGTRHSAPGDVDASCSWRRPQTAGSTGRRRSDLRLPSGRRGPADGAHRMKARTRGGARNGGLGVLHSPHGVELVVCKGAPALRCPSGRVRGLGAGLFSVQLNSIL